MANIKADTDAQIAADKMAQAQDQKDIDKAAADRDAARAEQMRLQGAGQ